MLTFSQDQVVKTSLFSHPSEIIKKKSAVDDQVLVKKIADSLKTYCPNSEDKASDRMNDFITKILEQIADADLNKISYSNCLKQITQQSGALFKTINSLNCSAEDAWFLWKHSSLARIHFHYDENPPSKKGYQFLTIAQQLVKMTNQVVFRGGFTDLANNEKSEEKIVKQEDIEKNKNLIFSQIEKLKDFLNIDDDVEEIAVLAILCYKITQATGIGNCREKCFVALKLLNDFRSELGIKSDGFQAEIFSIQDGDHVFLVIGRNPDSDPTDYTTWGKDAVICDPWADQCYFASELPEKLKNFVAVKGTDKSILRKLEPIHPHRHLLEEDLHVNEIPAAEKFLNKYGKYIGQSPKIDKTQAMDLDSDSLIETPPKASFPTYPTLYYRAPALNPTQEMSFEVPKIEF